MQCKFSLCRCLFRKYIYVYIHIHIPFCVYVCACMRLHSSDTFGESTSTKINYQIYHMITINNQMIQAVTLLPPSWRSPTTLERVTFSAELPGSLLYFHNEPLHLLDRHRGFTGLPLFYVVRNSPQPRGFTQCFACLNGKISNCQVMQLRLPIKQLNGKSVYKNQKIAIESMI